MKQPHLVYFADPMCSWCWGFSPVIRAIRAAFGEHLPIRLVLGGLRPGTTRPMDEAAKAGTRSHWEHVQAASGQAFDYGFFDRPEFIYDTEPGCRAVVLARRRSMHAGLDMLAAVQKAFYAENRDVTQPAVLADIAGALGFDTADFQRAFGQADLIDEAQQDFYISQQTGVTGFPTLIAGSAEGADFALVTQGFQTGEQILPALKRWAHGHAIMPLSA